MVIVHLLIPISELKVTDNILEHGSGHHSPAVAH